MNIKSSFFLVLERVRDQFHPSDPLVAVIRQFLEGLIPAVPLHAYVGEVPAQIGSCFLEGLPYIVWRR